MKTTLLGMMVGLTVGLGAVTASAGTVNCDQVRRYLKTGRSPEQVAETMVVDLSEVKKCQEQGGEKESAPPPPTPKEKQ